MDNNTRKTASILACFMDTTHLNMFSIAIKMLINSKKQFIGMVVGATLSAFILMQQPSIYQGVVDRIVASITSIPDVDLWIMDNNSPSFEHPTHFQATDIYRIRSIPGVSRATHLYKTWFTPQHVQSEKKMLCELIGIDPEYLLGLPATLIAGARESIYHANALIADGYSLNQFATNDKKTLSIGDKMIDGQNNWTVTGITQAQRTYSLHPRFYMSSNHLPNKPNTPSFILVNANPEIPLSEIVQEIEQRTHFVALTPKQFVARASTFFRKKTPIVIGFISIAIIGFIIGLAMMWQIFHNFILTHIHQFGMLKMLGVPNAILIKMVLFQALITGSLGYIIGLSLTALFGILVYDTTIAFHLTGEIILLGILGSITVICASSVIGILKVVYMDTIELCRNSN